jgi:hypothetical protein
MRHLPLLLIGLLLMGCGSGDPARVPPVDDRIIPAGPAEWVIVEQELPLDSLGVPRVVLPYGPASVGRKLETGTSASTDVVRRQVALKPDPLAPGDRCGMEVIAFVLVHADGSTVEVPASGHVVDNSDHREGFRTELSRIDRKRLVIPARATAVVVFDRPVTLPPR